MRKSIKQQLAGEQHNNLINTRKEAVFFVLVAFSASLPVMISPKQMGYYLIPSFPFFALAFSVFISPYVKTFIARINPDKKSFFFFKTSVFALLATSLFFIFTRIGKNSRDEKLLQDVYRIGAVIPRGEIISVPGEMCGEWGTIAYFSRYFYISLDCTNQTHPYKLLKKEAALQNTPPDYVSQDIILNNFILLKRQEK